MQITGLLWHFFENYSAKMALELEVGQLIGQWKHAMNLIECVIKFHQSTLILSMSEMNSMRCGLITSMTY